MHTLSIVNYVIMIVFAVCYSYQFLYIPAAWILKKPAAPAAPMTNRFAVLICARNEACVIADLIASIRSQTYPAELIDIFVMADNCTDRTAEIASQHGAEVYSRESTTEIGKGYALNKLLGEIKNSHPDGYDGYFVFDADNVLNSDYFERMNNTFSAGNDIVTSYRNSKNYGFNWVSAGYALWFLRESRYLNGARSAIGTSCHVSGTGFLFSRKIADEIGGWPFHMLTEDIEFSIHNITRGRKIAYCQEAELYDEQPVKFMQSWRQRLRWTRGYFQVFGGYGKDLVKGAFHGSFACFDMSMTIMPAFILSASMIVLNVTIGIWGALIGDDIRIALVSLAKTFGNAYLMLGLIGVVTTITEWGHIHATTFQKIKAAVTFPLFMFTYIPIAINAIFSRAGWDPIEHTMSVKKLRDKGFEVGNK